MQYLNKIFLLLVFYLFTSSSAFADDIVITRKAATGKALLDRKFIFMQGGNSFTKNSQSTAKRSMLNAERSKVSSINHMTPSSIPTKSLITKNQSIQHSALSVEPGWDAYAEEVEMEENLSVGARLLN